MGQEITARKLNEEEQRRLSQENASLAEIGKILSSSMDIDDAFASFAFEMKKLLDFDRATFNRVNEAEGNIYVKYVAGAELPERPVRTIRPLEGSFTAYLLRTGKGMARDDIVNDIRFAADRDNVDLGHRSGVAVPMMVQGRLIASLSLLSRRRGPMAKWKWRSLSVWPTR